MPKSPWRGRRIAPALLALWAGLNLSACDLGQGGARRIAVQQAAVDPPALWRVQQLGPSGAVAGEVYVCADRKLREGFSRTAAEVNGETCLPPNAPLEQGGLYATRCTAGGRAFGLNVTTAGDVERDFTTRFSLQPLGEPSPPVRLVRRYVKVGRRPAGWRIGDQARPGRRPAGSALG